MLSGIHTLFSPGIFNLTELDCNRALREDRSNLKAALLQLPLRFSPDHAPDVVGKSEVECPAALKAAQPAHTAWYTTPPLSNRLVPPSTCVVDCVPPRYVPYKNSDASSVSTMK